MYTYTHSNVNTLVFILIPSFLQFLLFGLDFKTTLLAFDCYNKIRGMGRKCWWYTKNHPQWSSSSCLKSHIFLGWLALSSLKTLSSFLYTEENAIFNDDASSIPSMLIYLYIYLLVWCVCMDIVLLCACVIVYQIQAFTAGIVWRNAFVYISALIPTLFHCFFLPHFSTLLFKIFPPHSSYTSD